MLTEFVRTLQSSASLDVFVRRQGLWLVPPPASVQRDGRNGDRWLHNQQYVREDIGNQTGNCAGKSWRGTLGGRLERTTSRKLELELELVNPHRVPFVRLVCPSSDCDQLVPIRVVRDICEGEGEGCGCRSGRGGQS